MHAKHILCCLSVKQCLSRAKCLPNTLLAAEGGAANKVSAIGVRRLFASMRCAFVRVPLHLCAGGHMSVSVCL